MFQLECNQDDRRDFAIDRIDWRPWHTHENKWRGPSEFRGVKITGTHRHSFDLNWFPSEARLLTSNLPIAVPLTDDIPDFAALLAFVAQEFRIADAGVIGVPPWERDLL
jgi:hypothetical protein